MPAFAAAVFSGPTQVIFGPIRELQFAAVSFDGADGPAATMWLPEADGRSCSAFGILSFGDRFRVIAETAA
jgi:hypothetical protein